MKTVLVVEDNKSLQDAICLKLEKERVGFIRSRSAEDAIKILDSTETVDAVWLDHYLIGDANGLAIIKHINESKNLQSLPVYVVSNTVTAERVADYVEQNAKKFYVKSECRLDEVVSDIKKEWETNS